MLSRQVDEERQGLQGSLAALTSLTSIVGPLLFTAIYAASYNNVERWLQALPLLALCRRCVAGFGEILLKFLHIARQFSPALP